MKHILFLAGSEHHYCTDRNSISPDTGRETYGQPWFNILSRYIVSVQTVRDEQSLRVVLSMWRLFLFCSNSGFSANQRFKIDIHEVLDFCFKPVTEKKSLKINPKSYKKHCCTIPKIFWSIFTNFKIFLILPWLLPLPVPYKWGVLKKTS